MNPAAGQAGAGAGVGQAVGQHQPQMYRPEAMRQIRFLTEDERGKYEKGLALLWKQHDAHPPGSPEHADAKKKILDFGRMLVSKVQQRRQLQMQQQTQAQQNQQGQAQSQPRQQQQPQQLQQQIAQPAQPSQSLQPTGAQPPAMSNPSAVSKNMTGGPPPTPTNAAPGGNMAAPGAAPQQAQKIPANILAHVNEMNWVVPAHVKPEEREKFVIEMKAKYARALYQMERSRFEITKLDQTVKDGKTPMSRDDEMRKAALSKQYQEAQGFVMAIRKQHAANGAQKPAQNGAAGQGVAGPAGNQGRAPAPARQVAGQTGAPAAPVGGIGAGVGGTMQHSTAAVNAAMEAAKNQQQLAAGRMAAAGSLPGQQGQPGHPNQAAAAAAAQAQPAPVTQAPAPQPMAAQAHTQQQTQIKVEPGTQQQPMSNMPAPLNTAIAAGMAGGLQNTGTPTQASARVQTPQSATPTNNIRPLTHAAAINLAASQQRPNSISAPSGSTPASGPGVMGSQQPGHPHGHPATQPAGQTIQSKMPIPKTLPEKAAQLPTPVAPQAGPGTGRPTFSGGSGIAGGVMNQPALAKTPAYQLEGEGERVLNKKKLDELVRQVCGGTAEGQEGNMLTPEVEEAVLTLADNFVDDVLHAACRIAKERGSKVLEIRDIQLVLERTYNIRIPGYSSDELRTVRKVQPNAQWITKMSAVQAAKVMPGKGDL
ncbi:hypothetical protein QBC47DRAFT_304634 [Echria macrotheca]|uniref:Transcription initiation factor TFIID subunit 12 domain-containing protein n=1 Tax=Echria macrotheca TaxID=438768 RepID=A0AAJ0F9F3_9PEZI|nr:hypothetical protein QBC47DRAFT_304634 [Echria macrotheca]